MPSLSVSNVFAAIIASGVSVNVTFVELTVVAEFPTRSVQSNEIVYIAPSTNVGLLVMVMLL